LLSGWRLYFYSNEGKEPIHVHCQKGDMECKFWINTEMFDIQESYAFNVSLNEKKIIFQHFDYIVLKWNEFHQE
jgi:hypothetical protein